MVIHKCDRCQGEVSYSDGWICHCRISFIGPKRGGGHSGLDKMGYIEHEFDLCSKCAEIVRDTVEPLILPSVVAESYEHNEKHRGGCA